MSDADKDKLATGHEYDGIQELDNPLPKWWLYTFYITIVFGVAYWGYYELFGGPSSDQILTAQMEKIGAAKQSLQDSLPSDDEVDVAALQSDPKKMEVGQASFVQYCAACHGTKGEGSIGPNLTDNYWISSKGDFASILVALREGFPTKGMPPWKDVVPADQHQLVAAYILTLKGTNPPNAKEPQGDLIE